MRAFRTRVPCGTSPQCLREKFRAVRSRASSAPSGFSWLGVARGSGDETSLRWGVVDALGPLAEPAVDDDLRQIGDREAEQGTVGGDAQERA
jgi:hypothetical protein